MDIPHVDLILDLGGLIAQLTAHRDAAAIYYSTESCWWSHLRGHAYIHPTMKCPAGGQIVAEKDWEGWLESARENPDHYGRWGIKAMLAAHHTNCRDAKGFFYAARTWEPYNAALDVLAEETKGLKKTAVARG